MAQHSDPTLNGQSRRNTQFESGLFRSDKPIRIGDFVQIEQGIEGYVIKIGWRSTQIQLLTDSLVVIPNSRVASSDRINPFASAISFKLSKALKVMSLKLDGAALRSNS